MTIIVTTIDHKLLLSHLHIFCLFPHSPYHPLSFQQGGPIKKVVFKDVFSYIEFEDAESVGYCLALFDGVELFGDRLVLAPKIGHQVRIRFRIKISDFSKILNTTNEIRIRIAMTSQTNHN